MAALARLEVLDKRQQCRQQRGGPGAVAGGDQLVEPAFEHEQQPLRCGSGLLDTLDQAGAAQLAALGDLFGPRRQDRDRGPGS